MDESEKGALNNWREGGHFPRGTSESKLGGRNTERKKKSAAFALKRNMKTRGDGSSPAVNRKRAFIIDRSRIQCRSRKSEARCFRRRHFLLSASARGYHSWSTYNAHTHGRELLRPSQPCRKSRGGVEVASCSNKRKEICCKAYPKRR